MSVSKYDRFVQQQAEDIQSKHQSIRRSIEAKRSALCFSHTQSALEIRSSLQSQAQELRISRERETSLRRTHVNMIRTLQQSASAQRLKPVLQFSSKRNYG